MKRAVLIAGLLLLPLAASAAGKKAKISTVTSDPTAALVTVVGFGECETPCRIQLDAQRQIVVAKAGYLSKRLTIDPSRRRVHVRLELAAPTTAVDSEALPEL